MMVLDGVLVLASAFVHVVSLVKVGNRCLATGPKNREANILENSSCGGRIDIEVSCGYLVYMFNERSKMLLVRSTSDVARR